MRDSRLSRATPARPVRSSDGLWASQDSIGRNALFYLTPLIIVAVTLRFYALPNRGLLFWDEGKFSLEGIRLLSVLGTIAGGGGSELAGKAVGTAKPTHALFIAFAYAIVGIQDYAPLYMNALASVIQVPVLYALGRRLFPTAAGPVAALIFAVSEYEIVYARSALSESDANLIFLLGTLLWAFAWDGKSKRLATGQLRRILAAVLLGLALTTNYRLIVYIGTLVTLDVVVLWVRSSRLDAIRSAASWCAGLALLPIVWEIAGRFAAGHGVTVFKGEIVYRPTTYFSELLYQLHGGKQAALRFAPQLYLQWFTVRQGWLVFILIVAGLLLVGMKRTLPWLIPAALVLVPFIVYMFAPFIVPRNLVAALPFAALLAGAALCEVAMWIPIRLLANVIIASVCIAIFVLGGSMSWRLTGIRSGYAEAAAYLHKHHSEGAIVVSEVMRFYLRDSGRECDAPKFTNGVHPFPVDGEGEGKRAVIDTYVSPFAKYVFRHEHRIAHFLALGHVSLGENPIASENGLPPGPRRPQHVDVYALTAVPHLIRHVSDRVACDLDVLA